MSDPFSVERYRRGDREQVFALVRAAYRPRDAERLIRQWDWKYDANPFTREADPYILLLKEGTRLAGMLGGLPLRVVIDGRERWASHSCDWVLHPQYRGRRVSGRIIRQASTDLPLTFSWVNEISYKTAEIFGGTRYARLTPCVKPLDGAYLLKQGLRRAFRLRSLEPAAAAPALDARAPSRRSSRAAMNLGVAIEAIGSFDDRFDRLWEHVSRDYPVAVVRDRRYLNWRFTARPDASYTILAGIKGSEIAGFIVTRMSERKGARWGHVVDFLVQDRSLPLFSLLVRHAVERLRRERAKGITCRAIAPPYRLRLYRHGFFPVIWGLRGYLRTDSPLSDSTVEAFRDPARWYVTMGDGDLEMSA